ncbi:hypothetical protein BH20ACI1_BH20ACI1_27240 [soil metagenome]
MIKPKKPSLTSYARPLSNHLIAVISLILVACLAIGIAANSRNIEVMQRWVLIVSLILLAFFGLSISVWLILRASRRVVIGKSNKDIEWQVDSPENQKKKLNDEVRELAAILEISDEQLTDLLSAFVVAEDLALRKIQQDERKPLFRHIRVKNVGFDAVLLSEDTLNFIEVTFLVAPDLPQNKINSIAEKVSTAKGFFGENYPDSKLKFSLVVVTQLDQEDSAKLRSTLTKERFSSIPVDIDINFYDFEELQKVYAME